VRWQLERGVRWSEKNNSADTNVSEEGGRGGARDTRAESLPLQLVMKTMVRQAVPLQPMEVHGGADLHLSPWKGAYAGAGGCLKEAVTPWGARTGAGSCQDLQTRGERSPRRSRSAGRALTLWGPTLEQPVPEGLHPAGGTHAGAVREELQPVGRTHIGEVCGELSPVRGTSRWSRGRV